MKNKAISILEKCYLIYIFFFCLPSYSFDLSIGTLTEINYQPQSFLIDNQNPFLYLTNPPIVSIDKNWNWICSLCDRIPSKNNKKIKITKDSKMITIWKLKNIHWQNGNPVINDDVVRTFKILREIDYRLHGIESIKPSKSDPKIFTVIFKSIRADFYQLLNFSILPKKEKKNRYPLAYGPYQIEKMTRKTVEFKQNEAFPINRLFDYRTIKISLYRSKKYLLRDLYAEKINLILEDDLDLDSISRVEKAVKKSSIKNIDVVYNIGNYYEAIVFNLRNPLLADIKVRAAIAHAINKEPIIQQIFDGKAYQSVIPFHDKDEIHPKDKILPKYTFNPEKSNELLKQTGWKISSDGFAQKHKQSLHLTLTTDHSEIRKKIYALMRDSLDAVGIKLSLQTYPHKKFISEIIPRARFSDLALVSKKVYPRIGLWSSFHSSQIPTPQNNYNGGNISGLNNRYIDQHLQKMYRSLDFHTQAKYAVHFAKLYTDYISEIPIAFKPAVAVIPKNLAHFLIPGAASSLSLIEKWKKDPVTIGRTKSGISIIR